MPTSAIDTSYRAWSIQTLEAVRNSTLIQIKAIEGTGQSHSVSGRQTTLADYATLVQTLTNIESALDWKRTQANCGNKGFASRFPDFSH